MRDSVRVAFVPFTEKFEGSVAWMYLDIKGLVTVAIGNLIDPVGLAFGCPFVRNSDGQPATDVEIVDEWNRIKGDQELARRGHLAAKPYTKLHLTSEGIATVVQRRLDLNEAHLRGRFIEWDDWPADAQLAVMSLAWACGPAFYFPRLSKALTDQSFSVASLEIHIDDTGNPGVRPRNKANQLCMENAAYVVAHGLDRETLHWPNVAGEQDTPTARELPSDETIPGLGRPDEALEDTIADYQKREPKE